MNTRVLAMVVGLSGLFVAGCADDEVHETARALLKDKAGKDFGTVVFTGHDHDANKIDIAINITTTSTHATNGDHAMHIHATGVCTPPAFTSAMGHWDPTVMSHGNPTSAPHHGGDLGNLTIAASAGSKMMATTEMALTSGEPNSIIGLAVVFHANPDDFVTQNPPGMSGARAACGVITLDPVAE